MSENKDKIQEEIEKRQEIEHQIDESIHRDDEETHYRVGYQDITKMQAPDQWPDPPDKNKESSDEE